ncbi:hypothetical protein Trydic_g4004 [Trypoxylus dichotomus]
MDLEVLRTATEYLLRKGRGYKVEKLQTDLQNPEKAQDTHARDPARTKTMSQEPEKSTRVLREVLEVIKRIPLHKSSGEDGIPNGALTNLSLKLLINLTTIFNGLTCYPSGWKSARLVPVPKLMMDHHSPESYCLISLLCTISKFGFRSGNSTTSQLFRIMDCFTTAFNRKRTTVMVSLDLEKAFVKICHEGLLLKMYDCGFDVRI